MKHLLLHAGTHKTGTTTIQRALSNSSDILRANGFYYPELEPEFTTKSFNHNKFAHAYADQPELEQSADAWSRRIFDQTKDGETVILSGESIYRHVRGSAEIPAQERRRIYLNKVAETLSAFRVEVILYFRRRDRYMESVFHERAATGRRNGTFDKFLQEYKHLADYQVQMEAFRAAFGNVRAISYEAATEEGLLNCFSRVAGCPPLIFDGALMRKSTDARISLWMESKRQQDGGDEKAARQRRAFSHSPHARRLLPDFGHTTLWDDRQRREFLSEFLEKAEADHRVMATSAEFPVIEDAFQSWLSTVTANAGK